MYRQPLYISLDITPDNYRYAYVTLTSVCINNPESIHVYIPNCPLDEITLRQIFAPLSQQYDITLLPMADNTFPVDASPLFHLTADMIIPQSLKKICDRNLFTHIPDTDCDERYYLAGILLSAKSAYIKYHLSYEQLKHDFLLIRYPVDKPWQGSCLHCPAELLWWEYAAKTPFYHDLMEQFVYETMMDTTIALYASALKAEQHQLNDILVHYEQLLKNYGIPT